MYQEIGVVLGARASTQLATSALPEAPVQAVPSRRRRHLSRRLLGRLSEASPRRSGGRSGTRPGCS